MRGKNTTSGKDIANLYNEIKKIEETLYGEPIDIWKESLYSYVEKKENSVIHRLEIMGEQMARLEKELKQSQCKHTSQSKKCEDCGKEL
jgi:uncharacterized protein with HEPN domain